MQEQKPTNPVDHPILNSPFEYPRHHWELDRRFRAEGQSCACSRGRLRFGQPAQANNREVYLGISMGAAMVMPFM